MGLWRQTVGRAVVEAPITRLRSPDLDPAHPAEGIIETAWAPLPAAADMPPMQRRGVAHFLPEVGGAWLETVEETSFRPAVERPFPLPSVTDDAALLGPAAGGVQTVAMWIPDPGLPSGADPEVVQLPPVSPESC